MQHTICPNLRLAVGLLLLLAQPVSPFQAQPLALHHATVIDMTGAPVRSDMTVVITGNRITSLGETDTVSVPREAQVVDATGQFVIPGLWDMYVHWGLKEYLPLFIANGVTGVRLMWGTPMHHAWRREIAQGILLGPRLVIASSIMDGPKPIWPGSVAVGNADEARQAVRTAKQAGADFIKIYDRLSREAFFAIVEETSKQGLRFAGHVPHAVSVVEAAEAGQHSIEHLTGILAASSSRAEELRQASEEVWAHLPEGERLPSRARTRPLTRMMLETFSAEKAHALFAHFTRHHTWQSPTLTVLRSGAFLDDPQFRRDPRLKYLPAVVTTRWDPSTDFRFKTRTSEDFALAKLVYQKQLELVGMMHRAGVEFLAGTDVLNPYCFPGFSLHDELGLLVEAGLMPLEALQSAILNPTRFLGMTQDFGTVEVGKIADLVLLDANPLEAISNTQKIRAVVVNGRLLDRVELDALLAHAEATAAQSHVPPQDVVAIAPAANVPGDVAAFSGRWAGQWENTLDHLLVVAKIEGRNVTFVYSWGVAPALNITRPGFVHVTGIVDDAGILRGRLSNGAEVSYRLSQDQQTLVGEYVLQGRTTHGSFHRQ